MKTVQLSLIVDDAHAEQVARSLENNISHLSSILGPEEVDEVIVDHTIVILAD